ICDCIEGVNKSGYNEVSFLSLSSSDYKDLNSLINGFINSKGDKKISVSLPSLRFDSFTLSIAETVQSGRKTGLTFAPEAGTQVMRNIINKNINEEEMLECIKIAFEKGWEKVKLYFMIGFPFENEKDIEAIPDLVHKIIGTAKAILPKNKIGRLNINLSINAFSPKPFTPFQWAGQDSIEKLNQKFLRIRQKLPKKFVTISWSDPERSKLECALARGNLKIADVIEEAFKNGAKFDNWSEFFDFKIWQNAFSKKDIDIDYFTEREADIHEVLPWDFIDISTSKEFLIKEFDNAKSIALNNGRRS
ncbi:MAG: radical SAM protein, partial [Actinomycetota bacterium]|nr:radical SAM protein [Actinomycetota bacterium]